MKVWSPISFESLGLAYWEGESLGVVYNPKSGETHLLEPFAIELIEMLLELTEASADALVIKFFESYNSVDSLLSEIESVLQQLMQIGLLRVRQV